MNLMMLPPVNLDLWETRSDGRFTPKAILFRNEIQQLIVGINFVSPDRLAIVVFLCSSYHSQSRKQARLSDVVSCAQRTVRLHG